MSSHDVPRKKIASLYEELVAGLRGYMKEHGFSKTVVGLSGGIDSAVTCCLAKEAVEGENVLGLSMPSPYSSKESAKYSRALAENLDIRFKTVPISGIYRSYVKALKKDLSIGEDEKEVGVYLQNIQARIRGNILMAFSNRFGHLVLATGNKSEAMMGYCTLYGDTAGGLAPLANILKTTVYRLAEYINGEKEVIPKAIVERHPSAELRPGQRDQDTLPPYDVLDRILYFLEEGCSEKELLEKGFEQGTVKQVTAAIERSEYKRKQVPPGLQVNVKLFEG